MKEIEDRNYIIPEIVSDISVKLKNAGFEAYLVGGCTRDLILGKKPKDWDITTNALPEEILNLFPEKSFYENKFGTVGIVNEALPMLETGEPDESLKVIEVTTYRLEAEYSDNRRPDNVSFSKNIMDDLQRRDFTINAIAIDIFKSEGKFHKGHVVDLYKGHEDLERKVLRTVGNPSDRFREDALRMLRAVRLSTELDFAIDTGTVEGIRENANLLSNIAKERVRDEFSRVISSDKPGMGLVLCQKLGILGFISKELEKSVGVAQNKTHKYDVWEHLIRSLQHASDKKFSFEIRLAALFHDIGKPKSRRWSEEKKDWTFHGHEVIGERITRETLTDLKFPVKTVNEVCKLVRWHMFFSDTEQITLSAVRRMVANVGKENIWNLMNVRLCDRIGTGIPKENPYRLRKYKSLIEQVMSDPVSVAMLKIDGKDIIEGTNTPAGPRIGHILHALLEEVLDDPTKNTPEFLINIAKELAKLGDKELKTIGEKGKDKKDAKEDEKIKTIRNKYFVE